jgi:hypothetical protein
MIRNGTDKLVLTKPLLVSLFIYYSIVMIGTLIGLLFFFRMKVVSITTEAIPLWICLGGSFLSAGLGSSVYYIRKLYKHCIRDEFVFSPHITPKEIGAAAYFFARPLFACSFAFLLIMGLKAENEFVSPSGSVNPTNFLYVCLLISFFCGFGAGKSKN